MVTSQLQQPLIDPFIQLRQRMHRLNQSTLGPWFTPPQNHEHQQPSHHMAPTTPSRPGPDMNERNLLDLLDEDSIDTVEQRGSPIYRTVYTQVTPEHESNSISMSNTYIPNPSNTRAAEDQEEDDPEYYGQPVAVHHIRIPPVRIPQVFLEEATGRDDEEEVEYEDQAEIDDHFIPIGRSNSELSVLQQEVGISESSNRLDQEGPTGPSILSTLDRGLMISSFDETVLSHFNGSRDTDGIVSHHLTTHRHDSSSHIRHDYTHDSYTDLAADLPSPTNLVSVELTLSEFNDLFSSAPLSGHQNDERAEEEAYITSSSRLRNQVEEIQGLHMLLQQQLNEATETGQPDSMLDVLDLLDEELGRQEYNDDDDDDGEYKEEYDELEDEENDDDIDYFRSIPSDLEEGIIAQRFLDANGVPCQTFHECLTKAVGRVVDFEASSRLPLTIDPNGVELDDETIMRNLMAKIKGDTEHGER